MKKLILALTVSALSLAAYAGSSADAKAKDSASCCADKAKAAGASCQDAKSACCEGGAKKVKVVMSPKAAGEAASNKS